MFKMFLGNSLPCFIVISIILMTNLISCDNKHLQNAGNGKRTDRIIESSADVIMREDAEEIFYDLDVEKYEDMKIKCPATNSPENGYLVGEDTRVGSVVYVKCRKGFWLSGPAIMACTVNNGKASWIPDSGRICVQGQTFFNEDDAVDEPSEDTDNILPAKMDREKEPDVEDLPPFIRRNHKWIPSLHELNLRRMEEDQKEERGFGRLRQELEDRLPPFCLARPAVGPCSGTFRRYYFDKEKMECKKFFYSGCGGNSNNFESIGDCMSICKGHSILGNRD